MKALLIFIIISSIVFSQEDLLGELDGITEKQLFQNPAFKSMKIGNLESTKIAHKGDLYLNVSHRFGTIADGVETFWGLDNALTKIQFIYGLMDGFHLSLARESFRKTYSGAIKFRIAQQGQTFPLNLVVYSSANINTQLKKEIYPYLEFKDRFSYASQLLISKRISSNLSFEIAPTFIRQNLEFTEGHDHLQYALGIGSRLKVTKRMAINIDYAHNFVRHSSSIYNNPLTIGLEMETGGHVFNLLFTNSQSSNEPGFMANASSNWAKGDIFFGFNLIRVF